MKIPTPELFHQDHESIKVGLCQVYTEEWTVEENLSRTISAIEQAAKQGAEIAVTPECVLHGYALGDSEKIHTRMLESSELPDGENLQTICKQAKALNIHIILGFVEREQQNRFYNSAAVIGRDGEIVQIYRKVHCRDVENIHHQGFFIPGDQFLVSNLKFRSKEVCAGTMICFDREIPETVRCLRSLGAEIVFCPLATDTAKIQQNSSAHNEMITRCRAVENELFIVAVNHSGRFNGGSYVVGPGGEVLCQMGSDPCVEVIEIPIGVISQKFHSNPTGWMGWGYRRPDVYGKYFEKDDTHS